MPKIKIATFNTEWMSNLFNGDRAELYQGPSLATGFGSAPDDVQEVCRRLAGVIWDTDAHIVGIQEGPRMKAQMELFVKEYLDDEYDVFSIAPRGRQCNHFLVWKGTGVTIKQHAASHDIYKHLTRKVEYYRWGNISKDSISAEDFTRLPVVLQLSFGRKNVELMCFHTKSKISKLRRKSQYTSRDRVAIVDALRSRQKLSAEMYAVRRYLTHAIKSQRTAGCILLGDLNDGPHRDIFEEKFLIHNIVDELRGGFHRESALMHHALPETELVGSKAFTAKFSDPTREGKIVKVLLDHIMVTTGIHRGTAPLRLVENSGQIEHEAFERWSDGKKRHQRPSDHRPVSAVFEF